MPLYHLHLDECGVRTADDSGIEVANLELAKVEAVRAARSIMCAEVMTGKLCLGCRIDVTDEDGVVLAIVPFAEAVEVSGLSSEPR